MKIVLIYQPALITFCPESGDPLTLSAKSRMRGEPAYLVAYLKHPKAVLYF